MRDVMKRGESRATLSERVSGVPFSFGPLSSYSLSDNFILDASGHIEGYIHDNEKFWETNQEKILIMNKDGLVMWESITIIESEGTIKKVILFCPSSPETKFIMTRNDAASREMSVKQPDSKSTTVRDGDYLFPNDLEVSESGISRVLLIGSCLTSLYSEGFGGLYPNISFDYIPYNFISEIPNNPPSPVEEYNFQYVQIPLRSVLSDRVIWAQNFLENDFGQDILKNAHNVIDAMLETAMAYNIRHGILTLVSNFIVPQRSTAPSLHDFSSGKDLCWIVSELNIYLGKKVAEYDNAYIADIDSVASSIGKQYILDDIIYFYSHGGVKYQDWDDFNAIPRNEPIPDIGRIYEIKKEQFLRAVFRQAECLFRTVRQIDQVKVVVFDLDNTLWRGQIAENYRADTMPWPRRDGWPMGLWEAVHALRARGILVAICSKNDLDHVRERWGDVVEPAFLSLDDFASVKINWDPKAKNIEEVCREFNIKPKSVVFVDDNPVEREAVISAFPEIRAIGGNPYLTRRILLWAAETQIARMTAESEKREDMIRGQIRREETRSSMSREEFLNSLMCEISFVEIRDTRQGEFGRAIELTNKTNQFNTTGKRWQFEEVSGFLTSGGRIFAFHVKDKFTEYGLVGVFYTKENEIVQYVMSCRVLGMGVEEFAVRKIVSVMREQGADGEIRASIRYTKDNTPCRNIYIQCGFSETGSEGETRYFLLPQGQSPREVTHIKDTSAPSARVTIAGPMSADSGQSSTDMGNELPGSR